MTNYAHIIENTAFLFSDFGEAKAREWFGDALVDSLPRYVRGKHKGKAKGVVVWQKVERGGWVRGPNGDGYAENRVGHIISRRLHEQAPFDRSGLLSMPYGRTIKATTLKEDAEREAAQAAEDAANAKREAQEAAEKAAQAARLHDGFLSLLAKGRRTVEEYNDAAEVFGFEPIAY